MSAFFSMLSPAPVLVSVAIVGAMVLIGELGAATDRQAARAETFTPSER